MISTVIWIEFFGLDFRTNIFSWIYIVLVAYKKWFPRWFGLNFLDWILEQTFLVEFFETGFFKHSYILVVLVVYKKWFPRWFGLNFLDWILEQTFLVEFILY
jgi:hypothetical protein